MKDGRAMILKADHSFFGRIFVIAQTRTLQMAEILSYPLVSIPWALATSDEFIRKINKATLQKNVAQGENVPKDSVTINDGMSLVHKIT